MTARIVLLINECIHLPALRPEVEALTEEGIAVLAICPSYATVAPAGGRSPLLGTNPFAFGWPRKGANPCIFDFATSVATRGGIDLYRRAGKLLPRGWAIDTNGTPATGAGAAQASAMLSFGDHHHIGLNGALQHRMTAPPVRGCGTSGRGMMPRAVIGGQKIKLWPNGEPGEPPP
uniref:Ldh family oxidoreductase n=1 Tax=Pannonibacter phragmitetus TaxID=121719 RepID=UPI00067D0E6A|nr:Ldh family oxidoreductase [Pannonibacter phragmitetus]